MDFLQFLSQFGPIHPFPLDHFTWTVLRRLPKDDLASWLYTQMTGGSPMSGGVSQNQGTLKSKFFHTPPFGSQHQPNSVQATFQPNSSHRDNEDNFMDWTEGPQVTTNLNLWQNQVPSCQDEQPMDVDVVDVKHINQSAGTSLATVGPSQSTAATSKKTHRLSQPEAVTKKPLASSRAAPIVDVTIVVDHTGATFKKPVY
ncbi:hypothetical protein DPEC_G00260090, partial [Dallia pectoralis]